MQMSELADGKLHKYELTYSGGEIAANVDGGNVMSCTPGGELEKASIEARNVAGVLVSRGEGLRVRISNVVVE